MFQRFLTLLNPVRCRPVRCIPCKGSRYPPTLPRPAVAILPFKLPLCQTTTEKGQMEVNTPETAWFAHTDANATTGFPSFNKTVLKIFRF